MNLLDEIRLAQRNAGEDAVIANLRRQRLIKDDPEPTQQDHQALSNDINDYQNTIAKQRKVLEQALEALKAQPIETLEVWKDGIDLDLPVAHSKLCKSAITAIQGVLK